MKDVGKSTHPEQKQKSLNVYKSIDLQQEEQKRINQEKQDKQNKRDKQKNERKERYKAYENRQKRKFGEEEDTRQEASEKAASLAKKQATDPHLSEEQAFIDSSALSSLHSSRDVTAESSTQVTSKIELSSESIPQMLVAVTDRLQQNRPDEAHRETASVESLPGEASEDESEHVLPGQSPGKEMKAEYDDQSGQKIKKSEETRYEEYKKFVQNFKDQVMEKYNENKKMESKIEKKDRELRRIIEEDMPKAMNKGEKEEAEKLRALFEKTIGVVEEKVKDAKKQWDDQLQKELRKRKSVNQRIKQIDLDIKELTKDREIKNFILLENLIKERALIKIPHYEYRIGAHDDYTQIQKAALRELRLLGTLPEIEKNVRETDNSIDRLTQSIQNELQVQDPERRVSADDVPEIEEKLQKITTFLHPAKNQFHEQIQSIEQKEKETAEFSVDLYVERKKVYLEYEPTQVSAKAALVALHEKVTQGYCDKQDFTVSQPSVQKDRLAERER